MNASKSVSRLPVWQQLVDHAAEMQRPAKHLLRLVDDPYRLAAFSRRGGGIFYDFSRQRIDAETLDLLLKLAAECRLTECFGDMIRGRRVNRTENRAALHTAARSFDSTPLPLDGMEVRGEVRRVREQIRTFSADVRAGRIATPGGRPFRDVVVIGIGGSYLGTEFVAEALDAYSQPRIRLYFLSNVDIHDFGRVAARIDPSRTLWVVISKSYTTAETMANLNLARGYMRQNGLNPAAHLVTVTSKGSPGDDPDNPVLASFHMFDFIGGRYSVTSAVGGVPLSLLLGYDCFERFLKGAEEMDRHANEAPPGENLPLLAALIGVWNNNFLAYPAQAIVPYAAPLAKLSPHIQQLNMESNGKGVTVGGQPVETATGPVIFGEPGTNAQHSFFQLAHQGRPFPIDFIGVLRPQYEGYSARSRGVTNHQELWANLIAQSQALAFGHPGPDPARSFSGNRPSSTLVLEDLSPESVGRLLSFYEARTVFEAFLWDINPFDQFGVELGKRMATEIRARMALRNEDQDASLDDLDPICRTYLEALEKGGLPQP